MLSESLLVLSEVDASCDAVEVSVVGGPAIRYRQLLSTNQTDDEALCDCCP